jgi:hypothetical protein
MELTLVDGKAVVVDAVEHEAKVMVENTVEARAIEVRELLALTKNNLEDGFLDMCDLLSEAQEGDYHVVYGFSRFNDWVEQSSLNISARQAFYFLNISKKARLLNISREDLKKIGSTGLKEIFSLEPEIHEKHIRQLMIDGRTDDLKTIKKKVQQVKNPNTAPAEFITLKLDTSVKQRLDESIELARKNYGDTMANGDTSDISISKAIELICESYLQDPNNHPENHQVDAV